MTSSNWTDRRLTLLTVSLVSMACGEETPTTPSVEEQQEDVVLQSIEIGPEGEQIRITDALPLSVTGRYSDGSEAALDPAELAWSVSSGADVVALDGSGTVVGQTVGTADVRGEHPAGASAGLEVTVRAFAAEGALDSPLAAALPYRGEVDDGYSVYRFDGLVPGEMYTIEVTSIHGDIIVSGYADDSYLPERCRASLGTEELHCPVPAGAGGEIYLIVVGRDPLGSIYSVDVVPGGIPNEGSPSDPVDVSASLPYAGTVSNSSSYYVIGGLSPGQSYTVQLTNASDDVTFYVASTADWGKGNNPCMSPPSDESDGACVRPANDDGEIHVRVYGGYTPAGASYTLDTVAGGFFDEGSPIAPLDVTGALPYSGQVAKFWSHYVVTGLVAGDTYTVTVDNVSDDVSLYVHSALGFQPAFRECTSVTPGADATESCAARAVNGELHISVGGGNTVEGATFTLDVSPGGIAREGNVVEPRVLRGDGRPLG